MRIGRRQEHRVVRAAEQLLRGNRTKTKLGVLGGALLAITLTGGGTATPPAGATTMTPHMAAKTVLFSGHYHGVASLLIDNGAVTISSVAGTGTGTLLGASRNHNQAGVGIIRRLGLANLD